MDVDKLKFIDLGLPTGKLWATENVKDENGNEAYLTYDEAVKTFGKNLPSKEDWKELFENSTYKWNKKKKGYDVTGPNGNSIFLPSVGYRYGADVYNVGSRGYYWSSSVFNENYAYIVFLGISDLYPQCDYDRFLWFSVRLIK